MRFGIFVAFFIAACAVARAGALPPRIAPSAPFPRILQQAPTLESIAPGIDYGDYQLVTDAGPLAIRIVAIDSHRRDVRVGSVVATDSLVSPGETVGSMARRTRAVAGINGDYFDIGATNRPINMVVRDGALLQLPYKRYVLAVTRDGTPHIAEFTFSGALDIDGRTLQLDAIDQMPQGGLSLLTPLYGRVPPRDNVTLLALEPTGGTPPLARYRVKAIADNTAPQPPGYYVAIGLNDYRAAGVPQVDSVVAASGDLTPLGLNAIVAAVGGGALILHDGSWYDDADAPYREENSRRMPCSGAAIAPDGRLFLVEVDGRQPEESVGVTRPQFGALMRSLGATEGLLLDGGGSSTLAVRRLGDGTANMVNSPSDGRERPVADGVFVYSSAPAGPPVRLVARPGVVRAIAGATVPLRVASVDAAYHVVQSDAPAGAAVVPASLGVFRAGQFLARKPGTGRLVLRDGDLRGEVALQIDASPARARIMPALPNVDPNGSIALEAVAFDAHGYPIELPPQLHWNASTGSIDSSGRYRAGARNANITVRIGQTIANGRVTVGSHDVSIGFSDRARFTTVPPGGKGTLTRDAGCGSCVRLNYSFSQNERAAYAMGDVDLPDDTLGIAFDVQDDGSNARLRVAVRNSIKEDTRLDATRLTQPGWRHVTVRFPAGTDATRLMSIYVLPQKGAQISDGSIVLRNVRAIVAGP